MTPELSDFFKKVNLDPTTPPWNRRAYHIFECEPVTVLWVGHDDCGFARAWVRFERTGEEKETRFCPLNLQRANSERWTRRYQKGNQMPSYLRQRLDQEQLNAELWREEQEERRSLRCPECGSMDGMFDLYWVEYNHLSRLLYISVAEHL